jgi:hypothetical protein
MVPIRAADLLGCERLLLLWQQQTRTARRNGDFDTLDPTARGLLIDGVRACWGRGPDGLVRTRHAAGGVAVCGAQIAAARRVSWI